MYPKTTTHTQTPNQCIFSLIMVKYTFYNQKNKFCDMGFEETYKLIKKYQLGVGIIEKKKIKLIKTRIGKVKQKQNLAIDESELRITSLTV